MTERDHTSSASSKGVILALNAESVFAIRWILGYLKRRVPVLIISPYDLRKNSHFSILRESLPRSDSIQLFQISSRSGYLSSFVLVRFLKAFVFLNSAIRRNGDKIIHAHNLSHFALLGLILNPRRLIISPYGSDVYSISWIKKLMLKLLLRRADLINPQSKFMANHLRKVFGVPKRKMITLHTGVDVEKWNRPPVSILESIKKTMGIPSDSIVFLSYRNFKSLYQIHLLPAVHHRLLKLSVPAFFIYVTNTLTRTSYVKKIEDLIKQKKLSQRSKVIVNVLKAERLAELLYISDYFFSIPKWDQVAATLQEGMYCECIPIVSDLEAYKEVVNTERAVIVSAGSLHLMTRIIAKAVRVNMHLNERIKKVSKNILAKNFNMEKNMNSLINRIIAVKNGSN